MTARHASATSGSPVAFPLPWYMQAARTVPTHFFLKGSGTTVFIAVFFAAYFYLLKHPARAVTLMPVTWLDDAVGIEPLALLFYLSLWVYVSLPPVFLASRRELFRYGLAIGGTCVTGLAVFYFWPTAVPPPDIDWARYPDLLFLKNLDAAGNACPSLHVATALFSGIWLHHLLKQFSAPAWPIFVNWTWCIGIVYSTMATRQHLAVDVGAGIVLGLAGAWLSLRRSLAGPARA